MNPTVGRIVHYTAYNGTCLAGLVINVPDPAFFANVVDLAVFTAMQNVAGQQNFGIQFHQQVHESTGKTPGHWHWPEREVEETKGGNLAGESQAHGDVPA